MPYLTESEQDEALGAMLSAIYREARGIGAAPIEDYESDHEGWVQVAQFVRSSQHSVDQIRQALNVQHHKDVIVFSDVSVDEVKKYLNEYSQKYNSLIHDGNKPFDQYEGIVSNETKDIIELSPSQWLEQLRKKKVWDQDRFANRDDQLEG